MASVLALGVCLVRAFLYLAAVALRSRLAVERLGSAAASASFEALTLCLVTP